MKKEIGKQQEKKGRTRKLCKPVRPIRLINPHIRSTEKVGKKKRGRFAELLEKEEAKKRKEKARKHIGVMSYKNEPKKRRKLSNQKEGGSLYKVQREGRERIHERIRNKAKE